MRRKLIKMTLLLGLLAGVSFTTATEAYVLCSTYNGTSCTTPGTSFRCFNRYPDEPGLCRCTSSHLYVCG